MTATVALSGREDEAARLADKKGREALVRALVIAFVVLCTVGSLALVAAWRAETTETRLTSSALATQVLALCGEPGQAPLGDQTGLCELAAEVKVNPAINATVPCPRGLSSQIVWVRARTNPDLATTEQWSRSVLCLQGPATP